MTVAPDQLPRLLAGLDPDGPLRFSEHLAVHGQLPAIEARRGRRRGRSAAHPLLLEVEAAGLRGLGGGSFPSATKLAAVAAQGGRPVVLVNGAEGEPLSHKDRLLLARVPHLVIDGAVAAAAVLGGREIVLAIDRAVPAIARILDEAVAERPEFAGRSGLSVLVAEAPHGYLVGQESALINALDGGPARPVPTPSYPFESGLGQRPTLVSNVETYAQLGLIARHGADWYRTIGTPTATGSRLISVAGAVAEPGVIEVAGGTDVATLLRVAGGESQPLQALLFGGYAGAWTGLDGLELPLDEQALRQRGLTLGAGILFALPAGVCPVSEVARVTRYLERESAGQCGPCINGLGAIATALEDLCRDGDRYGTFARIERWCAMVSGRGACSHPDGVARFVSSALRVFRPSFEDHARSGRCDRCGLAPWLPAGGDHLSEVRRERAGAQRDRVIA